MRGLYCMLEDRGYLLSPQQAKSLALSPMEIASEAMQEAISRKCSLGQAYSFSIKAKTALCSNNLPNLSIGVIDRNYDEARSREVMISSNQLRACLGELPKSSKTIVLLPTKLSPDGRRLATKLAPQLQTFLFDKLFFPVGRHAHVPRHIGLTEEESRLFEQTRSLQRFQLPILRQDDPVVQYYDFPANSIVKIERGGGPVFRFVET